MKPVGRLGLTVLVVAGFMGDVSCLVSLSVLSEAAVSTGDNVLSGWSSATDWRWKVSCDGCIYGGFGLGSEVL